MFRFFSGNLLLKIALMTIGLIVVLNIFLPEKANQTISLASDLTGIKDDNIKKVTDLATDIVKDGSGRMIDAVLLTVNNVVEKTK